MIISKSKPSWYLLALFVCTNGVFLITILLIKSFNSGILDTEKKLEIVHKQNENSLSTEQVYDVAQSVTVKVFSGNTWGSGTLVCKEDQTYTVLTSKHLLEIGDAYRIQTHDGQLYQATKPINFHSGDNDIEVLQFQGNHTSYKVAALANSSTVVVGDVVFAAGFSFEVEPSQPTDFIFTNGQISLVLDQALENGYQIGYTNQVAQGMSGGALFNAQGQVIGVNGMDKYPLWGNPYIFQDGSMPSIEMREQMRRLSWAIPIQTFIRQSVSRTFTTN